MKYDIFYTKFDVMW